jgi:hypothetical protein
MEEFGERFDPKEFKRAFERKDGVKACTRQSNWGFASSGRRLCAQGLLI